MAGRSTTVCRTNEAVTAVSSRNAATSAREILGMPASFGVLSSGDAKNGDISDS